MMGTIAQIKIRPITGRDPKEFVCDSAGAPLPHFHGTNWFYEEFSANFINSVGFHFGCRTQATHRARLASHRIIKAYLLKGRRTLEIRGRPDPGWENPGLTCLVLHGYGVFTLREAHELGFEISVSNSLRMPLEVRRLCNTKITGLLMRKGYDSVAYSNDNEPKDGIRRDAYCVFSPDQIFVAGFEDFDGPTVKATILQP